ERHPQAVRRHHRRRDGADVVHAADAAHQGRRGRCSAAGEQDGHGPRDGRARQGDQPRVHVLRRLRPRAPPRRGRQGAGRRAGLPAAVAEGGQPRDPQDAAPPDGCRRRVHRHRRPHRRHRRDPQHQGVRGGEGAGVLPGDPGGQPRRPGVGAAARRPRPGGEGRRGARVPGRQPARRAPAEHPRDVRGVPRGLPQRQAAGARHRRTAFRREDDRRARRGPDLRPRHHAGRRRVVPRAHPRRTAAGGPDQGGARVM
ncbi:MAG: L-beta-lysine 5,6-aminomutase beta subunit @ D-lysine 5,6-aminomutase beta subunit, partial [uncultured Nocardioidaceae bacterium]